MPSISITILALCAALLTNTNAMATSLLEILQDQHDPAFKSAASIMDGRSDHLMARNNLQSRDFVRFIKHERTAAGFALTGALLFFMLIAAAIYFLIRCAGRKSSMQNV
ncbi:hypothetical protein Slin15195_G110380 [Septoria linicola]|uniref:Uncharacterized protein n=1 Tax=Septoria linicola TaxID=215465 RepID=A0A9Q9EPI6_9PEZI|nr:hypothetical protein Slin14017_G108740 [Septoria linicola]USW57719.1 hypothetical protein Slin15195_G110380 [Septoria linicola]